MLDAALAIRRFTVGAARASLDNEVLFWALVAQLAMLGEAAARVTESTRTQLPTIPWTEIVGMRNQLVHGYWSIDADELWRTVERDIPQLTEVLQRFLAIPESDVEAALEATFGSLPDGEVPERTDWQERDARRD